MLEKYEMLNQERKKLDKKRKVAAYCRVSTDSDDQANSFESQQRYFKQYIEHHPDWELYEIFADEGISGTNTKKRKQFNRMIACAKNGDFDLIITKEISRFARNTLDSIYYTRDLRKHGVAVIFMNDGINTMDGDAELRLAIMSSIAQEESRRTSERVKWGQKRQMEQGVVFGRSMLGYDVRGGKMYINEEGAKIVRLIFHKFVNEGKGTHVIARELREEGIRPMRVKEWQNTVILRVIRNEKYCGDLVQKKTYTPDFLSHEKKYNRGQEEFVIIKDHHEPIISRELFEKANRILDEKSLSQEGKAKHSNRYPFSGKIKCGRCGASYVARYKTRKDGSQYKAWRCFEGAKHGRPHIDKAGNQVGCSGESIRNEDAIYLMYLVCKELKMNRQKIISNLTKTIEAVISMDITGTNTNALAVKIEEAKKKRTGLIELYTSGDIDKSEFTALRAKYDEEIEQLKSMADGIEKQQDMINKQRELSEDIQKAIEELISGVQYEDDYYTQLLDKMVVNDKNHIDVYLNMLPYKWQFAMAKSVKGTIEASTTNLPPANLLHAGRKKAEASECSISEASLPVSLYK
ncbi:recombinase family protein [Blautia sp. An249]|uniref:recombinase family protein n=1 Tax=Blautia sp. An249 TaxID=1965603 RepID=UPI000B3720FC|nr:recombinase family protein [Blautia sp. An249]OUO81185.1 recombinase family protein [Blautia sp. An249]